MPRIDVALVYRDGRKQVVSVGRPADLIAFADRFEKAAPSEPYAIFELAWLAHRALKIEKPIDAWVDELDDLIGNDEAVDAIRDELELPTDAADQAAPERSGTARSIKPTSLKVETPVAPPAIERGIESLG